MNAFNNSDKDSLDVLIMGSSHAAQTYIPLILDNALNIKSHNFGCGGQRLIVTNNLLKDILKETKPKLLILDVFWGSFDFPDSPQEKGLQLKTIDNIDLSFNKLTLADTIYSFREMPSVFSSTLRNHDSWHEKYIALKEKDVSNNSELWSNGYIGAYRVMNDKQKKEVSDYQKKVKEFLKNPNVFIKGHRTSFDFMELKRAFEICKENNVDLLVVSAPDINVFNKPVAKNFYTALQRFCDSLKVDFLSYHSTFNEVGFKVNDFRDKSHLNIYGADKATNYLVKFLLEKQYFDIEDSIDINEVLEKLSYQFKNVYEVDVEEELFPDIYVKKIKVSKNNKYYQIILETDKGKEMNKLLGNYRLEYEAYLYKKDLDLLTGKFKGKEKELYGFNPKIISFDGKNYIYLKLPKTNLLEYKKIRFSSFIKKKKKTTQKYDIIFDDIILKAKY